MNNTPRGNRKHVVLYGKTNSGKSSLFNKLCNSNISIVSEREGTTLLMGRIKIYPHLIK